jgi:hypothetical protein
MDGHSTPNEATEAGNKHFAALAVSQRIRGLLKQSWDYNIFHEVTRRISNI